MSDGKCTCGKDLHRRTVATKTKKIGKYLLVEAQDTALVCPACGVIAFQSRPATPLIQSTSSGYSWGQLNA